MNKDHGLKSVERGPLNLFHAATERDKEQVEKHHVEMIAEGQINIFEVDHKKQEEAKSNMTEQALAKLKAEMAKAKNNAYVQAVGEYLVNYLQINPASADKFMAEGKTIAESLGAMRNEAEKKKQGNFAMLAPQEGFAIVLKYFGLEASAATIIVQQPVQASAPAPTQTNDMPQTVDNTPKNKPRFEASLDDFL